LIIGILFYQTLSSEQATTQSKHNTPHFRVPKIRVVI